jgi:excisionase family DNA binding protein
MSDEKYSIQAAEPPPSPVESDTDFLFNAEEVGALLGCRKEHVQTLVKRGIIPGTKIGRSWIFVRSQIREYVLQTCMNNIKAKGPECANATSKPAAGTNETVHQQNSGPVLAGREPRVVRKRRPRPGRPRKDLGSWDT